MKKHHVFALLAVLALFGAAAAQAGKTTICHIPPGNPANWHTITISDNAVQTHIDRHGDVIGSCSEVCEQLCDDGDACTQDVLSDLDDCICQTDPPPVDCDDGNECTVDSCSSVAGACVYDSTVLDGEVCDDGDPTTTGEVCGGGVCEVPEEPNECDFCVDFDTACDGQAAGATFQSCETCGGFIECVSIFGSVAPQLTDCAPGTSWDDSAGVKACVASSTTCNYTSCTGPGGFPN